MLTFADLVAGYEREGDKKALLHLRRIWDELCQAGPDASPMVKLALAGIRSERLALIDAALRRMESR
jgi:hypothetical protein